MFSKGQLVEITPVWGDSNFTGEIASVVDVRPDRRYPYLITGQTRTGSPVTNLPMLETEVQPVTINRVTYAQALAREVAKEGPDFVYELIEGACWYNIEGKPSCLHGRALWSLGHTVTSYCEGKDISEVLRWLGVADQGLRYAARQCQIRQDSPATWGAALQRFGEALLVAQDFN